MCRGMPELRGTPDESRGRVSIFSSSDINREAIVDDVDEELVRLIY